VGTILGHLFYATKLVPSSQLNTVVVDYMIVTSESSYTFQPLNRLETCEVKYNNEISFTESEVDCNDMNMVNNII
jgi:hypothetical protein